MHPLLKPGIASLALLALLAGTAFAQEVRYFKVPTGAGPHDVAPAPDLGDEGGDGGDFVEFGEEDFDA